jgi:hypothetical protein
MDMSAVARTFVNLGMTLDVNPALRLWNARAPGNASIAARIAVIAHGLNEKTVYRHRVTMAQPPRWFDPAFFCSAIAVILSLTDLAYV